LVAEVAQGYYNLLMLDKQLEITKSNLALSDKTLTLIKKQFEVGIGTALAVQQQETNQDQIRKHSGNRERNKHSGTCTEYPDRFISFQSEQYQSGFYRSASWFIHGDSFRIVELPSGY
jgi:hypothetical protein